MRRSRMKEEGWYSNVLSILIHFTRGFPPSTSLSLSLLFISDLSFSLSSFFLYPHCWCFHFQSLDDSALRPSSSPSSQPIWRPDLIPHRVQARRDQQRHATTKFQEVQWFMKITTWFQLMLMMMMLLKEQRPKRSEEIWFERTRKQRWLVYPYEWFLPVAVKRSGYLSPLFSFDLILLLPCCSSSPDSLVSATAQVWLRMHERSYPFTDSAMTGGEGAKEDITVGVCGQFEKKKEQEERNTGIVMSPLSFSSQSQSFSSVLSSSFHLSFSQLAFVMIHSSRNRHLSQHPSLRMLDEGEGITTTRRIISDWQIAKERTWEWHLKLLVHVVFLFGVCCSCRFGSYRPRNYQQHSEDRSNLRYVRRFLSDAVRFCFLCFLFLFLFTLFFFIPSIPPLPHFSHFISFSSCCPPHSILLALSLSSFCAGITCYLPRCFLFCSLSCLSSHTSLTLALISFLHFSSLFSSFTLLTLALSHSVPFHFCVSYPLSFRLDSLFTPRLWRPLPGSHDFYLCWQERTKPDKIQYDEVLKLEESEQEWRLTARRPVSSPLFFLLSFFYLTLSDFCFFSLSFLFRYYRGKPTLLVIFKSIISRQVSRPLYD